MSNIRYTAFGSTQFAFKETLGYDSEIESTDGSLIIDDLGLTTDCEECHETLPRPSYVTALMAPNWPHLSYTEAFYITHIQASSVGSSNGYCAPKEEIS